MVIGRAVGLEVVLRFGQHHAIDQNAWNLHLARTERIRGGDALDLRYDEAAGVLGCHGRSEIVEGKRLPLHSGVAVWIAGRSPDECDVDWERLVAQPFLAVDFEKLDEILGGHAVKFAALLARIDESAQSHLRDRPWTMRRDLPVEMRDAAERKVVGLYCVVERQLGDLRVPGSNGRPPRA